MTRQQRPASPLYLNTPLYDSPLTILNTLFSLSFLFLPIVNTQMVTTNITHVVRSKNVLAENFTKANEYVVTPNSNELINTVSSKNYQTLIDRFRRKDTSTTDSTHLAKSTIENKYDINIELAQENSSEKLDNSMEKLKVDDATRTKIFNDFSKTVKTVTKNQSKIDVSEKNPSIDKVDTIEGITDMASNESLEYPTRVPTSYHIPAIKGVQQTPRPGFLDGKAL